MFSFADKINTCPLIILVLSYQLFPAPFPATLPNQRPASTLVAAAGHKSQGCSLQGFTLSHWAGPGISPCRSRAASTGSLATPSNGGSGQLPTCLHPSGAACTPEPMGSWWGPTTGSSADRSGQGRKRMERGREGGSAKGQVQHSPCCQHGAGWAAGERWYLTDFPTPRTSSPGGRMQAGDAW